MRDSTKLIIMCALVFSLAALGILVLYIAISVAQDSFSIKNWSEDGKVLFSLISAIMFIAQLIINGISIGQYVSDRK